MKIIILNHIVSKNAIPYAIRMSIQFNCCYICISDHVLRTDNLDWTVGNIDDVVQARWTVGVGDHVGKWYSGKLVSIDTQKHTSHVDFDDGDVDTKVKWIDIRLK